MRRVASGRPLGLISYDGLPVSAGGGHRLRRKDRLAIWESMRLFFDGFTTAGLPDEASLHLAEGPRVDALFSRRALKQLTQTFGPPAQRSALPGSRAGIEHRWALPPADADAALAAMRDLEPFPEHWLRAPLVLAVRTSFALRDPETGDVLPAQDPSLYGNQEAAWRLPLGLSRAYLRLTTASTCMLFLSLPFPDVDDGVRAYAKRIDAALPFRLSRKHWSRWQLNARGTAYYRRRVDVLGD